MSAVSIATIDIDRFKLINVSSGHQVGDVLLCEITARISGRVRWSDAACRLGGDRFTVLLATRPRDIGQQIVRAISANPDPPPVGQGRRR